MSISSQQYDRHAHNSSYCGVKLTMVDLTQVNWYAAAAAAVYVIQPPAAHAPTHTRRPNGLLIVHAMLTLAAKVLLCRMTRV